MVRGLPACLHNSDVASHITFSNSVSKAQLLQQRIVGIVLAMVSAPMRTTYVYDFAVTPYFLNRCTEATRTILVIPSTLKATFTFTLRVDVVLVVCIVRDFLSTSDTDCDYLVGMARWLVWRQRRNVRARRR